MALAIVPILLIIIGIIIYATAAKRPAPVWSEVGRAMFFAGFIGLAVGYAHKMINIG